METKDFTKEKLLKLWSVVCKDNTKTESFEKLEDYMNLKVEGISNHNFQLCICGKIESYDKKSPVVKYYISAVYFYVEIVNVEITPDEHSLATACFYNKMEQLADDNNKKLMVDGKIQLESLLSALD